MIPTNLTLSSQLGLSKGLSEVSPEEGLDLQLTDLSEINFTEFFLKQFQPESGSETAPTLETEEVSEAGNALPLLPTLLVVEPETKTEKPLTIGTTTETEEVATVIPNKQSREAERPKETPELLNKVILDARPEQKEIQAAIKEQQSGLVLEKSVIERATENKPELLIQPSIDKADKLKLIDKTVQVSDKPAISSITSSDSAQLRPLPTTATTNQSPLQLNLDTPFAQAKWGESLAGRVMWMMAENHTSAKINLNPAELGPIEVRVSVNNDQTNVNFVAQHGVTRDAIEDAFPRLREMFSQNGINLGEANVSDQSLANKGSEQREFSSDEQAAKYSTDSSSELSEENGESQSLVTKGIVDQFV